MMSRLLLEVTAIFVVSYTKGQAGMRAAGSRWCGRSKCHFDAECQLIGNGNARTCACKNGFSGDGMNCLSVSRTSSSLFSGNHMQVKTSIKIASSLVLQPSSVLIPLSGLHVSTKTSSLFSGNHMQGKSSPKMAISSFFLKPSSVSILLSKSQDLSRNNSDVTQQTNCPAKAKCIEMGDGSCVCYCIFTRKTYSGIDNCQDIGGDILRDAYIYQANKKLFNPEVIKQDEERMFQATLKNGGNVSAQVSFNWFVRDVQDSPRTISQNRTLVEENSSTWICSGELLSRGLKLLELEVSLFSTTTARRDFGFIKVEEPDLVAMIAGGCESLRSSKYPMLFNGSGSHDWKGTNTGMEFVWICRDGGKLPCVFKGVNKVTVPSEEAKEREKTCPTQVGFRTNGSTAYLMHPSQNHVYYIKLLVRRDHRRRGNFTADFMQTVYAVNEDAITVDIRCKYNCKLKVVSSHRFALKAKAIGLPLNIPNIGYTWKLYRKGPESNVSITVWHLNKTLNSLTATKTTKKNIVFAKDKLHESSSYRLTLDVKLPNGTSGWAAYIFETASKPSGGACSGTQLERAALGVILNVSCTGWRDDHEPLIYEFYYVHREEDETPPHMLSHGAMPYSEVQLPEFISGETEIKAVIINTVGARAEVDFTVKVVQPSFWNETDHVYKMFEETEALFDNYLDNGKPYGAWQVVHSLLEFVELYIAEPELAWLTNDHVKNLKEHIIKRLFAIKATNLQTVLQLLSVLKEATAFSDVGVSPESMRTALLCLDKWASVAKTRVKMEAAKDLGLVRDSWRMLLHCSGNILQATAQVDTLNVTEREEMKKLSRRALMLNEKISDAEISTKLPGEKHSSMRTLHKDVFVGVHDATDVSLWDFEEDETSVTFPYLSKSMSQEIFGDAQQVAFQIINYKMNPYAVHRFDDDINSQVVSLVLKDEAGKVIKVSNLHENISLTVPLKRLPNKTMTPVETYTVPDVMIYRVVTTDHESISLRILLTLHRQALMEVYVKYGGRPTKTNYDHTTILQKETCQNDLQFCDVSHYFWFNAERPGQYFIGLVQKLEEESPTSPLNSVTNGVPFKNLRRRRVARSLEKMKASYKNQCVRFKEAPKEHPMVENSTGSLPQYDPEKSVNFTLEVDAARCLYWSEDKELWMSEGCKAGKNSTPTVIQCLCNHFTSFGGSFLVQPNKIDFSQVQVGFRTINDVLVLLSVLLVFLVYLISLIFARRADKRDLEKVSAVISMPSTEDAVHRYSVSVTTGAWANSGTSANVSMILHGTESSSGVIELKTDQQESESTFSRGNTDNFFLAVDKQLGHLQKIRIGHDSSGECPSWFLNSISITEIETNSRWIFPCYRWLALEKDDGNTTLELFSLNAKKGRDFKSEFNNARLCGLANDHLWFSVVTKEPRDTFTRVQRVTCCWFFLLLGMLTSIMFYIGNTDTTQTINVGPLKMTEREFQVSVFSALISFPPSVLVVFMFSKSRRSRTPITNGTGAAYEGNEKFVLPNFFVYIAWFVCVVGSLVAGTFIILHSLPMEGKTSARWLSSVFLSTIEDVFVTQPVKIVILSVLLALRLASRGKQRENHDEPNKVECGDSQVLFPMSDDEVERKRKYRVTERKTNIFMRDIAFSCVFITLLMFLFCGDKNENRYRMAESTKSVFVKLDKIRDKPHLWKWFEDVLIPATFASEWYNGQKETITEYTGNKRSILIGMPSLRQLRVLKDSCVVPYEFADSIPSCYDFYDERNEDKMGWNELLNNSLLHLTNIACTENWKYRTENELGAHQSLGQHALYSGGGYVANLGYDGKTASAVLQDLHSNGWIDRQTRVVIVELSTFNVPFELLAKVIIYFEMLPSGFLGASIDIQVMPLFKKNPASVDAYQVVFLVFAFVLGYYLVSEYIKVYKLKWSYLASIWNWLEMIQVISATLVVAFFIVREIKILRLLRKVKANPFAFMSFDDALFWFQIEEYMICIAVTVAALRLLRLLKVIRHIIELFLTMKKSLKPVMSFCVVYAILIFAYGHTGILLFGKNVFMFSSFERVIMYLFHLSLGRPPPWSELEHVNAVFARLYSQSFIFLFMIIASNMFMAILNEAQTESRSIAKDSDDIEVANSLLLKVYNFLGIECEDSPSENRKAGISGKGPKREIFCAPKNLCENEAKQAAIPLKSKSGKPNLRMSKLVSPARDSSNIVDYGIPSVSQGLTYVTGNPSEELHVPPFGHHSESNPLWENESLQEADVQNEFPGTFRYSVYPPGSTLSLPSGSLGQDQRKSSEHLHSSLSPDTTHNISTISCNSFNGQRETPNARPSFTASHRSKALPPCDISGDRRNEPESHYISAAGRSQELAAASTVSVQTNVSNSNKFIYCDPIEGGSDFPNLKSNTDSTVYLVWEKNVRHVRFAAGDTYNSQVDHTHTPSLTTSVGSTETFDDNNALASCTVKSDGTITLTSKIRGAKIVDFDKVSEWMKKANVSVNNNTASIECQTECSRSAEQKSTFGNSVVIDFDEVSKWMKGMSTITTDAILRGFTLSKKMKMNRRITKYSRKEKESERVAETLKDRLKKLDSYLHGLDFGE